MLLQRAHISSRSVAAAAGSVVGNLAVVSNALNSPSNESLSGTGVSSHSVSLSWTASSSPHVIGYNVYRGITSGGPYAKLNTNLITTTNFSDLLVFSGYTYYYVTTAVDSQGSEVTLRVADKLSPISPPMPLAQLSALSSTSFIHFRQLNTVAL
jgi:hypothetical protein